MIMNMKITARKRPTDFIEFGGVLLELLQIQIQRYRLHRFVEVLVHRVREVVRFEPRAGQALDEVRGGVHLLARCQWPGLHPSNGLGRSELLLQTARVLGVGQLEEVEAFRHMQVQIALKMNRK
jgi:hypothetical protein